MAKKPASRPGFQTSQVVKGNVSGDLAGRDKTVTQKAGGDIVGGDKITTSVTQTERLAEAFRAIQAQIQARPDDPKVGKDELEDTVKRIEAETRKGEQANTDRLERWLLTLGGMADDIFQVVVATLANPALGIARAIQLIAQKAKEERAKSDAASG
jgi:hypothetical protein